MENPRISALIRNINTEISGKKRREECVKGDKVVYVGGYYKNPHGEIVLSHRTSSFIIGDEYELRNDYSPSGYNKSYDNDKNHVLGSFQFVRDNLGSKNNGWAAALFEPI